MEGINCVLSFFIEKQEAEDLYCFDELCGLENIPLINSRITYEVFLVGSALYQILARPRQIKQRMSYQGVKSQMSSCCSFSMQHLVLSFVVKSEQKGGFAFKSSLMTELNV